MQVDYSQYSITDDPPSPPKKKRRVDLKRQPSAGRIAADKYKTKPLNLPQLVRRKGYNAANTTVTTQPSAAGTSTGKGTIMKPATEKETNEVIN